MKLLTITVIVIVFIVVNAEYKCPGKFLVPLLTQTVDIYGCNPLGTSIELRERAERRFGGTWGSIVIKRVVGWDFSVFIDADYGYDGTPAYCEMEYGGCYVHIHKQRDRPVTWEDRQRGRIPPLRGAGFPAPPPQQPTGGQGALLGALGIGGEGGGPLSGLTGGGGGLTGGGLTGLALGKKK